MDAVFGVSPVGFETNGFLIPPSVLCAHPELYHHRELTLRVKPTASVAPAPASAAAPARAASAEVKAPAPSKQSQARPAPASASAAAAAPQRAASAPAAANNGSSKSEAAVVHGPLVFQVNAGEELDVYASDLEPLMRARAVCVVARIDIEPLIERFKALSGSLSAASFQRLLRELLPAPLQTGAAYELLVEALNPVYQVFANRAGVVDPVRCSLFAICPLDLGLKALTFCMCCVCGGAGSGERPYNAVLQRTAGRPAVRRVHSVHRRL